MGWVVNATLRPLYPQERNPVSIVQVAGWDHECSGRVRKILPSTGVQLTDLLVCCIDYALPAAT